MVYAGAADQLLLFSSTGVPGEIDSVSLEDNAVTTLVPAGAASLSAGFYRESALVSSSRHVVLGTTQDFGDGEARTPAYDVAGNRWLAIRFEPVAIQESLYDVSLGLMYDEARDLVWAVNANSELFVLRLDLDTADVLVPP